MAGYTRGTEMVCSLTDRESRDLDVRRKYSIHALPGNEDEEFYISGEAHPCNEEAEFRSRVASSMGFATGVDEHHIFYDFWDKWMNSALQIIGLNTFAGLS